MTTHVTESELETLLHGALRATGTGESWATESDESWCRVAPPSWTGPAQGWKLHVSATAASAPAVLEKALEVLLRDGAAFKFARSLEQVSALNTRATPRGSSGKFITVYPASDADAARLAQDLHTATRGLAGPRILSDRPYAPNSLVHYRYGAFAARRRLSDEGLMVWYIEDPDGNPVEDKRTGSYAPPSWAVSPFPESVPVAPPRAETERRPVVLGGRFSVREAIRHTNKGGVYRGTDLTTGAPVVIKETRPHVEADASGSDVRDWLRTEARTLEKLKGTGLAPEPLAMFEHGGHLFLAQEEVPGIPLRNWVAEHFRDAGATRYHADALAQAARLVDLVEAAHARGCVLRDFTPANVMVRPDGALRLIDLELAVLEDDAALPSRVGTPGFSAPERLVDAPVSPTGDYYSLGATLCFVLTGKVPNLLQEEPATRPAQERLGAWLGACAGPAGLPDGLRAMILGLMRDEPAERWDPARARDALRESGPPATTPAASARTGGTRAATPTDAGDATAAADAAENEAVVAGIVQHLVDSMTPEDDRRLWPVSTKAGETDACTVQQGAAGVLAVLTRYFELTGDPRLPELISTAGRWIADRTDTRSTRPGLHFGGRGTAWALYDAGRAVDDRALVDHALALALAPQESTPSHDITHGSAGSGLAAVHLWHRTGDPRFAERVVELADRLAAAARRERSGASWPVPAEAVVEEAGKRYLGFAHGTSGIGCFLLEAAAVSKSPDHRELALAAGEHLVTHAVMVDGAAQWPAQETDVPTAPYWCHGSAGIGSFLVRLWRATGDERFGALARAGTRAVVERASRAAVTQCHGLAGNGDYLLDMAEATGDPAYRAMAEDLARLIRSERTHRGSHVVFPNEYGDVSTSWSDGSAGILGFLLRIRHTEPRHWMVQQPV
ncbi:class IV lanthionine synthetase LanL [Streptomyces showdoensis]|uniref:non-specific serine/threonine protein kinase n=1 Tax=Streptomyces showdoensis TaxID=68268 RepID=A0A2P2GJV6_STREW|nr:class IV lanthionine synthetase LanL [Streptomyces showdoensis]KKZ71788.1 membrane protein [Streptomyces showdoensis]